MTLMYDKLREILEKIQFADPAEGVSFRATVMFARELEGTLGPELAKRVALSAELDFPLDLSDEDLMALIRPFSANVLNLHKAFIAEGFPEDSLLHCQTLKLSYEE
jgi:hypothetical protein